MTNKNPHEPPPRWLKVAAAVWVILTVAAFIVALTRDAQQ